MTSSMVLKHILVMLYIKPYIDELGKMVKDLWDNYLKTTIERLASLLGTLWKDVIIPLADYILKYIFPRLMPVIEIIGSAAMTVIRNFIASINMILGVLDGLIKFISGVFSGDWKKAWEGVKQIFSSIADGMKNIWRSVINGIIGIINGMINAINNKLKITY